MAGASPSFSGVHVIRALMLLNTGKTGRKNLVKVLGVGGGSVRTILKRLRRDGFIKSSKKGQMLTDKGRNHVQRHLKKFTAPMEFKIAEKGKFGSLIIIRKMADKIKTGFEQRDIAVMAGSDSVLVLNYKNGRLEFPTTTDVTLFDFPDLITGLNEFNPRFREDDVVVLSFGKTYSRAEDGAIAVALDLIKKIRNHPISSALPFL